MASPRTTPGVQEQPVDGLGKAMGGGSVRPVYRYTTGVNISGMSAGTKINPGKLGAGSLTVMGMNIPEGSHPAQASFGARAGSK